MVIHKWYLIFGVYWFENLVNHQKIRHPFWLPLLLITIKASQEASGSARPLHWCALALETANSDQVIEITPNKFTYFSQRGSNSYNTISPGSNTIGQLTQFTTLNIPIYCHLDTPDFYTYRRDSLSLDVDP